MSAVPAENTEPSISRVPDEICKGMVTDLVDYEEAFNQVLNLIFRNEEFMKERVRLYEESLKFNVRSREIAFSRSEDIKMEFGGPSECEENFEVKSLLNIFYYRKTLEDALKDFEKLKKWA